MNDQLQELLAKRAITEVITRYARGVDRMDEALLRSVFHPGSEHHHFYEGPSSDPSLPSTADQPGDFVAFAFGVLSAHSRTHHQLGNILTGKIINRYLVPVQINPVFRMIAKGLGHAVQKEMGAGTFVAGNHNGLVGHICRECVE